MEFIKELTNKNYEVHVGAPFEKEDFQIVQKLNSLNIRTHVVNIDRYNINFLKEFFLILSLIFTLIKVKPKTIISYTIKPVIYGTLCALVLRIKNKFNIITGLAFFYWQKNL